MVNPNNYYSITHLDPSELIVLDRQRTKVLDVKYINEAAVSFTGIIRYDRRRLNIVAEGLLDLGNGMTISYNCIHSGFEYSDQPDLVVW